MEKRVRLRPSLKLVLVIHKSNKGLQVGNLGVRGDLGGKLSGGALKGGPVIRKVAKLAF